MHDVTSHHVSLARNFNTLQLLASSQGVEMSSPENNSSHGTRTKLRGL
jgi:hypothetical protein